MTVPSGTLASVVLPIGTAILAAWTALYGAESVTLPETTVDEAAAELDAACSDLATETEYVCGGTAERSDVVSGLLDAARHAAILG